MAINVDHLREGLTSYQESLQKHQAKLEADFGQLHERFVRLAQSYDGEAANAFKHSWIATEEWFEGYVSETKQLSALLQERIDSLSKEKLG